MTAAESTRVTLPMYDITAHNVTVHGHPVAAMATQLAQDIANIRNNGDIAAIAVALNEVLACAVDLVDEGYEPGELYWSFADVIDPIGAGRLYIQVERTAHGLIAYRPTIVADDDPRADSPGRR